jgi:hypothetical protein
MYIFSIGCYFASSNTLQQAFGVQFISYGLSLIFISLLAFGLLYPFKYGIDRHNRFVLAVVFVFESIVFGELINFGLTIQSYTYPTFNKDLQLDCSRNTPLKYSTEECTAYFNHDRTAGFRLVWAYYFSTSTNVLNYQVLSTIQGGLCCGFYPPFKCTENKAKFPSNRVTTGITSSYLKQRTTCSQYENYYPEQYDCADVKDYSTNPPIIGGCEYDLGVSFCLDSEIYSSTSGCSSYTEDYVVNLIAPHAPVLLGLCSLSLIYMLLCCCMWWKRKEVDVFPEFVNNRHNEKIADYHEVGFQFTVKPRPKVLIEEGFLPPPQEEEEKHIHPTDDQSSAGKDETVNEGTDGEKPSGMSNKSLHDIEEGEEDEG